MSWLQVEFNLNAQCAGPVESLLEEFGAFSLSYSNAGVGHDILEPPPQSTPLWQQLHLAALLGPGMDQSLLRQRLAKLLDPEHCESIRFSLVKERNWVAEWQKSLAPLQFGERLWIIPGTDEARGPESVVVRLEPGLAFGTGTHETTALCLEWMAGAALDNISFLDYGCGSGILAIAALQLGAAVATAVDIDDQALEATRNNARRNGCDSRLRVCTPRELIPHYCFDVVVANIHSGILISLSGEIDLRCGNGARLLLSGILSSQVAAVRRAYHDWVSLEVIGERGDWVLLSGTVTKPMHT